MRNIFLIPFLLFLTISLFFLLKPERRSIFINDNKLVVEIADTVKKRKKGLMYRDQICADCGMLLEFNDETPRSIWMKNMNFSLDVIWINAERKIVAIKEMFPDEGAYQSEENAQYILEVNSGYAAKHNIMIGDEVFW